MFILLAGISIIAVTALMALAYATEKAADWIPFSVEKRVAQHVGTAMEDESTPVTAPSLTGDYIGKLAEKLASVSGLPEGMEIIVHYDDDDVLNAFATLGGVP